MYNMIANYAINNKIFILVKKEKKPLKLPLEVENIA